MQNKKYLQNLTHQMFSKVFDSFDARVTGCLITVGHYLKVNHLLKLKGILP